MLFNLCTDLSEPAIEKARSGIYLENALSGVSLNACSASS